MFRIVKLTIATPILLTSALLALFSCVDTERTVPDDALASIGNEYLTLQQVHAQMPSGLEADDSAAFVKAFVRQWAEGRLIEQVAAEIVDMDEIDRLTTQYRRELIMNRYRRRMSLQANDFFSEDSLQSYYQAHSADFKLDRPLIKGVYLKVPSDAAELGQLRRLYTSDRPSDLDRLEKAVLGNAVHYDYFRDTWVDWEQIDRKSVV